MRPTDYLARRRVSGDSGTAPTGPAMTTMRSVVARLALVVRSAGIVYIAVQVAIFHSFYAAHPWRLAGPAVAIVWAAAVTAYLWRRWPGSFFAGTDSAVYVVLALTAQADVPPAIRDVAASWLVVGISTQLIVSAWYAPDVLAAPLALASPVAFWVGVMRMSGTGSRTIAVAMALLLMAAGVHIYGRRVLYGRAAVADAALDQADRAASEQYVILSRNIERREHERLLHDTVLNTLTALARAGSEDVAEAVSRCRQDVALVEGALSDSGDLDSDAGSRHGDLASSVQAVAVEMRARTGLSIHVEIEDNAAPAVPAPVAMAFSNAVREALSNVAAHAGTRQAWVAVSLIAPDGHAQARGGVLVTVRDRGAGFDLAGVDRARLGLRRSIAERIADCGGKASIWSAPGQGTMVRMAWPAQSVPDEAAMAGGAPGGAPGGASGGAPGGESLPW